MRPLAARPPSGSVTGEGPRGWLRAEGCAGRLNPVFKPQHAQEECPVIRGFVQSLTLPATKSHLLPLQISFARFVLQGAIPDGPHVALFRCLIPFG